MSSQPRLPVIKEPKLVQRSNRKMLLFITLFFLTLLLILFFQSNVSKIAQIEIKGNHYMSEEQIMKASKLATGDHFFASFASTIEDNIKSLSAVENVTVSKHFPGLIKIEVKEYEKVAFYFLPDGTKTVILANGESLSTSKQEIIDKPILSQWDGKEALRAQLTKVLLEIPTEMVVDISEIKPNPSTAYPDKITIFTRTGFEVHTTISLLPSKIPYLKQLILDLKNNNNQTGNINLLDADYFSPFQQQNEKETTQ